MKLLLDENISYRLVDVLKDEFPGSKHVINVGLHGESDQTIYAYAVKENFVLVTKDDDFVALAATYAFSAPLVLVRLGNVSNHQLLVALQGLSDRLTALIDSQIRIVEIA